MRMLNTRRLSALVVVSLIPAGSVMAVSTASPTDLPPVEFVKVEGQRCLQPIVHAPHVTSEDYGNAESRWLGEAYPGMSASRWESTLRLDGNTAVTIETVTAYLDDGVGPNASVCFDVNFSEPSPPQQEPAGYRYEGQLGYRTTGGRWNTLLPDAVLVGWGSESCEPAAQSSERLTLYPDGNFTLAISPQTIPNDEIGPIGPMRPMWITAWPCYRFRVDGCDDAVVRFGPNAPSDRIELSCPSRSARVKSRA